MEANRNRWKLIMSWGAVVGLPFAFGGCWAVAAGAGAEAAYVATQEDRTAGETIDDQRIPATVKSRLLADRTVSGMDINVDTFRRVVVLKGVVESGPSDRHRDNRQWR
ncbi:MAG: hypothetical protein IT290_13080 [Deltaproteobacteria bacterium]|nr:hypothetical protein [Deltaproteobacteria bacterium]